MTGNPKSKIENLKLPDPAERAGEGGQSHQMTFSIADFGFSIKDSNT
jgi:hypothetical protein